MTGLDGVRLPCLAFDGWSVTFPERGHSLFLPEADLRSPRPATGAEDPLTGVWLARAESGLCVIVASGARVLRARAAVSGIAVLHHGDRLQIAGHAARFRELGHVRLQEGARLVGRRCAFCLKPVVAGGTVIRCPLCGVPYCLDCWQELDGKRCCSRGCFFSPAPIDGE